jgi:hypothetical protein
VVQTGIERAMNKVSHVQVGPAASVSRPNMSTNSETLAAMRKTRDPTVSTSGTRGQPVHNES